MRKYRSALKKIYWEIIFSIIWSYFVEVVININSKCRQKFEILVFKSSTKSDPYKAIFLQDKNLKI